MNHFQTIPKRFSAKQILQNSLINKGTAFTQEERNELGLHGLLPSHISSPEEQIDRAYANFHKRGTPIEKYEFLIGLLNRNELLFYQFVSKDPARMLPYIYTPTVGEAALQFSSSYFAQRGLYLAYPMEGQIEKILAEYPQERVDIVVVTDGERILGLGDLGIGGMTIPVGKLSLYSLFGGVHPAHTLPIVLDVGTNNEKLLQDPLYLGLRKKRVSGEAYDEFIACFVRALKKRYPKVLLQWEDFGKKNARRILDRHRQEILSFNDDIQGTAAVTLAGLLAAIRESKQSIASQRIAILGAGSAGVGIADLLVEVMMQEGVDRQKACDAIYLFNRKGLIHFDSTEIAPEQEPYRKSQDLLRGWQIANPHDISLRDAVANLHPTILIGVSAQGGVFTQDLIQEMGRHVERPIVFPLSNPTSKAECTPEELVEWTEGRAIIATGSPFHPVAYKERLYTIGQCNNVYIFPGLGLGALAAEASQVTQAMFLEAAKTLASLSPAVDDPTASLFPPINEVRLCSQKIALAVGRRAIKEGVSSISPQDLEKRVEDLIWEPSYPIYRRAEDA